MSHPVKLKHSIQKCHTVIICRGDFMKQEQYISPEIEIITFEAEDVICSSFGLGDEEGNV